MVVVEEGVVSFGVRGRELERYGVRGGERAVYARAVGGGHELVDVPVGSLEGQVFTIDPCWQNEWTMESFARRYGEVGEQRGRCPVEPDLDAEWWEDAEPDEALAEIYWQIGRS